MIVYTVETIGGQITSYEANKENLPKFLEKPVSTVFVCGKLQNTNVLYILPYRLHNMLYNGQLNITIMEKYNYLEAIKEDVLKYINENNIVVTSENRDEVEQELNDTLFTCDSVTGNASGSYTFNAWKAEEYLCHNWELLGEALTEFGCDMSYLEKGAEACDVTIRCYLLGQAISEVLDEVETEEEE